MRFYPLLICLLIMTIGVPSINSLKKAPQDKLNYPQEEIVVEVHHHRRLSSEDTILEVPLHILQEDILLTFEEIAQNTDTCGSSVPNELSSCIEPRSNLEVEHIELTEGGSSVYLEEIAELIPTPSLEVPPFESFLDINPTIDHANILNVVPAVEIYLCPPNPLDNCTPQYQQVCATYQSNCPNNNCRETLENECTACSNPDIHTYTPGACPPDPVDCDPANRPDSCDDNIEPVCGTTFNCLSNCRFSFRNKCHACLNPQIANYVPGTCPSEIFPSSPITFCESPPSVVDNEVQNQTISFVCSYYKNCTSDVCSTTSLNPQSACANPLVDYYTSRKCTDDFQITEESITICSSDQSTPTSCENNFDPVCAYFNNSTGPENSSKTFLNQCSACNNDDIQYTVPGACKNDQIPMESFCDVNNRPMMCSIEGIAVCGRKIDCEEENCFATFSSDCFACGKPYISSYLSGECAQQGTGETEKIYCDPKNRPKDCSQDVIKQGQPVCGVYSIVLNGVENKTFESSCHACENTEVQYYLVNACTQESEDGSLELQELAV